jgi:hypothetical protein
VGRQAGEAAKRRRELGALGFLELSGVGQFRGRTRWRLAGWPGFRPDRGRGWGAGGGDGAGPGEQSCPGDEDERTRREGGTRPSARSSGTRSGVVEAQDEPGRGSHAAGRPLPAPAHHRGVAFAVVKTFGDDHGGNLSILLAWNAFFALLPLLLVLVLVTLLGYLLGRQPPFSSGSCTPSWRSCPSSVPSSSRTSTRWSQRVRPGGRRGRVPVGRPRHHPGRTGRHGRDLEHPAKERPVASAGVNVGMFLAGFRVLTPRRSRSAGWWRGGGGRDRLAGAPGRRRLPGRPQSLAYRGVRLLRRDARAAVMGTDARGSPRRLPAGR